MITRASHWDRSAFLTSSRAWFWCSGGKSTSTNQVKDGEGDKLKNKLKKKAQCLQLWLGIGEIIRRRASVSPHMA